MRPAPWRKRVQESMLKTGTGLVPLPSAGAPAATRNGLAPPYSAPPAVAPAAVGRPDSAPPAVGRSKLVGTRQSSLRQPSRPAALSSADVRELAARVAGPVLLPGDEQYLAECAAVAIDSAQPPAAVVGATGAADVIAAVAFATDHGMPIAVRATGHSATALPADTMLINTARMQSVHVDPMSRIARVEAGVRWERVIHEAAVFGLAPLAGSSPHVGAVGYTMGGGLGLLGRAYGYAADHVHALDIVTVHGMLRRATPAQLGDLFWAVRGGKDNFGVVTSMDIGLFPVRSIYGGGLYFRGSDAAQVLNAYRRWLASVPEELSSSYALNRFPMSAELPEQLRGRFTVHVRIAYCGDAADGERLVQPLRSVAVPLWDTLAEMPFSAAGSIHNDPEPRPEVCESSALLSMLDEDAVDALMELVGPDMACPLNFVELRHLGGALGRSPQVGNAVGHRTAAFQLYAAGPLAQAEPVRESAALVAERMAPWSTGGTSLNFIGAGGLSAAAVRAAYAAEDYRRLLSIKRAYDPENLFRGNHNIPPAVPAKPTGRRLFG